jgi:hypothetical protein
VTAAGIIGIVAGIGSAGFSGDGGPALLAQFRFPAGVAVDNARNLYIADQTNTRIRKVNLPLELSVTADTHHVFPQFADGRFSDGSYYRSTLMVSNPSTINTATCSVQLRGLFLSGFNSSYSMPPGSWIIAPTSGTQQFQSGSATLDCSFKVEAYLVYSLYSADDVKLSEATVFSSALGSGKQILADGREGARMGLAVANDSDSTASYTVTAADSTGVSTGTATQTLSPRSSRAAFVDEIVSVLPNAISRIFVISQNNAYLSAIGLRFTGPTFTTIPATTFFQLGVTASKYHVFPQFADGKFSDGAYYRTTLTIAASNIETSCTVQLHGLERDGFTNASYSFS